MLVTSGCVRLLATGDRNGEARACIVPACLPAASSEYCVRECGETTRQREEVQV